MTMPMYRIGQVARLLQVSNHHIRQLCASGLIRGAEQTDGGWHIPVDEVKRLQVEGVPPIPAMGTSVRPRSTTSSPPSPSSPRGTSKAGPSPTSHRRDIDGAFTPREAIRGLIDLARGEAESEELQFPEEEESTSSEVREALDSVKIEAARLQQRKIQLQAEEVEDSFRAREEARIAEAQRARAEQNRQLAEAARIEWRNRLLKYAQDKLPYGVPPDVRLQVNDAVAAVLDNKLSVNDAKDVVSRVVDAVVAISLKPYHYERRKREIIDKAIRAVPPGLYHHLYYNDAGMDDAKRIARQAMERLGVDATDAQLKAAASSALQPLGVEFEHNETKKQLIDGLRYWRWCARNSPTDDERTAATEAVTNALDACPPGTPAATMEKIKDQTLAQFDKQIEERASNEQKKRDAQREADRALHHVTTYVGKEYEFDSLCERRDDEKQLEDALRPILVAKFLTGEFREAPDAHRFIDQYIDRHIRLEETDDR